MRREICGECEALINDDGSCDCTKLIKRGWRTMPAQHNARMVVLDGRRYVGELLTDDARRVVACVNACAGIPTEVLVNAWLQRVKHENGD